MSFVVHADSLGSLPQDQILQRIGDVSAAVACTKPKHSRSYARCGDGLLRAVVMRLKPATVGVADIDTAMPFACDVRQLIRVQRRLSAERHGRDIARRQHGLAHDNGGRGGIGMDADDKATLQAMGSSLAWAIIIAPVVAAIAFQLLV